MQKETTAYWAVVTEDLGKRRSAESAEQVSPLLGPGKTSDLNVSLIQSTGIAAATMSVTLAWTV